MDAHDAPARESEGVDVRARLRPGSTPRDVQELIQETVETPMRETPQVTLEESTATSSWSASR